MNLLFVPKLVSTSRVANHQSYVLLGPLFCFVQSRISRHSIATSRLAELHSPFAWRVRERELWKGCINRVCRDRPLSMKSLWLLQTPINQVTTIDAPPVYTLCLCVGLVLACAWCVRQPGCCGGHHIPSSFCRHGPAYGLETLAFCPELLSLHRLLIEFTILEDKLANGCHCLLPLILPVLPFSMTTGCPETVLRSPLDSCILHVGLGGSFHSVLPHPSSLHRSSNPLRLFILGAVVVRCLIQ